MDAQEFATCDLLRPEDLMWGNMQPSMLLSSVIAEEWGSIPAGTIDLVDMVEPEAVDLGFALGMSAAIIEPSDWDTQDVLFEDREAKFWAPDHRSISTSAATLAAMTEEEYVAYFEDLTGLKYNDTLTER